MPQTMKGTVNIGIRQRHLLHEYGRPPTFKPYREPTVQLSNLEILNNLTVVAHPTVFLRGTFVQRIWVD